MADDFIKDLIGRLPAQAVLPATVLAVGLSIAQRVPKLLEGLGTWGANARLKRELEIYKLRYEIAALKKQHGLEDFGEDGRLLRGEAVPKGLLMRPKASRLNSVHPTRRGTDQ